MKSTQWAALALLAACSCAREDDTASDDITSEARITYYDDIAPLLNERCATCHTEGGIAPFSLTDLEAAQTWASPSLMAMSERRMPPWGARADGECGEFIGAQWLTESELETFAAWVDGGLAAGDPAPALTPEPPLTLDVADTVQMSTPPTVPDLGEDTGYDEYWCFRLDAGLSQDRFLTGYDILPGNPSLVHHVVVMPVDPAAPSLLEGANNGEVMASLDAQSPDREGWPCWSLAGPDVYVDSVPVSWAPGQGAVHYPDGTGVRINADSDIIVQVHYNIPDLSFVGQSDETIVALQLEEQVEREGMFFVHDDLLNTMISGTPQAIPAGMPATSYRWALTKDEIDERLVRFGIAPGESVELLSIFPHMHEYGVNMQAEVSGAERSECVLDVPRWDFNWQFVYNYTRPVVIEPGEEFAVTCTWDTSATTQDVYPGWGTEEEMCFFGLFVVPAQ